MPVHTSLEEEVLVVDLLAWIPMSTISSVPPAACLTPVSQQALAAQVQAYVIVDVAAASNASGQLKS